MKYTLISSDQTNTSSIFWFNTVDQRKMIMKRDNNNNNNNQKSNFNLKDSWGQVTDFYQDNRTLINGIGIAVLAGAAVYSIVKWLPFEEIVNKIEEKFDEKFADREFSSQEQEGAYAH